MPRTMVNCPNCRQPVTADITQIFDAGTDPSAKQRLLAGAFNLIQCPNCGYQGNVATPLVYHDPDKELLLTFVPPEIGLPRDDQERLIGGFINQIVNNLPQEKRKGYLLRPQATLTMQGLVERILEAEGVTREMIQSQQQRLSLIQRLMDASDDVRAEIARQEDQMIDSTFFGLLRRLMDSALMAGDQESAQQLGELQEILLQNTTFGHELQAQSREIEAAMADLQSAGKDLTREKLLDLVIHAPSETRLRALVSLARPFMDYAFFQTLSERIERARADGRTRLAELRSKLLEMTQEVDRQVEARVQQARQLLDQLLQAENISEAMLQNLPAIDEFFVQELNAATETARKQGDLERLGKLQQMVGILQQMSSAPPEVALIEELLEAPDDQTRRQIMQSHQEEITPEFLNALANIAAQVQSGEDQELAERISSLNRMALRFSMEKNLR